MAVIAFDVHGFTAPLPLLAGDALKSANSAVDALGQHQAGSRELLGLDGCRQACAAIQSVGVPPATPVAVQSTLLQKVGPLQPEGRAAPGPLGPGARAAGPSGSEGLVGQGRALVRATAGGTARAHAGSAPALGPCQVGHGPLRVVVGSHRRGGLTPAQARSMRDVHRERLCVARAGEAMRPLPLHASSRALSPAGTRRVLHFLFGPSEPGFGLQWSTAI